ncbi:stealth family protein [Acinetobacter bohemicus]|uniref:Stealth CR1 domain-containing protein n=1 Tax=Acinetobacter lwoffii TaxID=28090 RepID=A0A9D2US79_ACILW|nr:MULTISPECIES: Stealth CR1 domain-containing protein [Acinetobacter]MDM1780766.1 Stealth CR1 domain-containing protein [Acinetobacter indicus]HJF27780.1 Stealth CR1 domain-containing protein [Acinetobacter lwoffii]MCO8042570.1 stealth family protein [Acinetobacter sp. S4400-12]MCO8046247.1 stealth family protein [Acinetobacter sp. S4397-1]MCU7224897.1 stealth family protein [Acinetobacter bohemicus]
MQNIDIVIAWVDGNDIELKKKRHKYLTGEDASDAISDTRFASNNEIYYNVASILKYVPFYRNILIVTDNQRPAFIDEFAAQGLCSADKIRIVDHREIFSGYEQYLPTFNTRSIESMLWNIEGLSDYFIYLNDDFFFNSTAHIEDFLQGEHLVIYGHWQNKLALKTKLKYRQFMNKQFAKPIQPKHMIAQMLGADILGFNKFFEIHHYPHIVDRQILKDYLLSHPRLLETQVKFKFRSVEQLNPISLMNHLKIQKQQVELKPDIELAYLKNEDSRNNFIQALDYPTIKYGCIQSLDQLDAAAAQQINVAMQQKLAGYLPNSILV